MIELLLGLFVVGQIPTVGSTDFPNDVQQQALRATVRVLNASQNTQGTGVIVFQQKPFVYILTANHVVDRANGLEVQTFSAASYPKPEAVYRSAEVLAHTENEDLAVLRLATTDAMPGTVRLCPPAKTPRKAGFEALTVGCANGRSPTCRLEKVTGNKRVRRPGAGAVKVWETDTPPAEGRSGGPLFDRQLQLLGIASGTGEGSGFFIHVEEIYRFLRRKGLDWLAEPPRTG